MTHVHKAVLIRLRMLLITIKRGHAAGREMTRSSKEPEKGGEWR